MKLNMHLIPRDSLAEDGVDEFDQVDMHWVNSIVEASEQYDREIEIKRAADESKSIAGVESRTAVPGVGHLAVAQEVAEADEDEMLDF